MGCFGSTVVVPRACEINLQCSDGTKLAAQSWRALPAQTPDCDELRVLCLHGWMDNCASYSTLAPALIQRLDAAMEETETNESTTSTSRKRYQGVHVVALDLPGHGLSSHKSSDSPPMVRSEYLFYIAEAVKELKWWNPVRGNRMNQSQNGNSTQQFVLVGHSMSAGLSLLYSAAFPEQVQKLILLDSLGHLSRPANTTSQNLRQYVQSRQLDGPLLQQQENCFYYPTLEAIVKARIRSPSMFPGKQYISEQAARELVKRGVVEEKEQGTKRRFRFRHDPRLMWNSIQYFTMEQLEALYKDIQCPTCVLLGQDGWPVQDNRREQVQQVLNPVIFETLPGSHHLHMDPDTADRVVNEIVSFVCNAI